eukprot:jgi/Mesvir1/12706/Mv01704-RA.1
MGPVSNVFNITQNMGWILGENDNMSGIIMAKTPTAPPTRNPVIKNLFNVFNLFCLDLDHFTAARFPTAVTAVESNNHHSVGARKVLSDEYFAARTNAHRCATPRSEEPIVNDDVVVSIVYSRASQKIH